MAGDGRISDGATIAFATSAFEANIKLESLAFGGISREAVPLKHLGLADPGAGKVGNVKKLIGAAVDAGELSMDIFFDPDADLNDVLHAALEEITITWPLGSGQTVNGTWVFTGAIVSWNGNGAVGEKLSASITVTIDDDIAITAGS